MELPRSAFGKLFVDAETDDSFGRLRPAIPPFPPELERLGVPVAEDECGNYFIHLSEGQIGFWDHETDEIRVLASDAKDFAKGCKEPKNEVLNEGQIRSVWVNPEFAKRMGIQVPTQDSIKEPKD